MFGKHKNKKSDADEFEYASGESSLDAIVMQHVPDHLTAGPRGRDARMHPDEQPLISLPEAESA